MAPNRKIFALKRIKLQGKDSEASKGFVDEITLLQRLRGKQNIIQLIDAEVIQAEGTIYMVLEYGDIDLARLLAKHEQDRRESAGADALDENFIRLYWQQMLQVCASMLLFQLAAYLTACICTRPDCICRCLTHPDYW